MYAVMQVSRSMWNRAQLFFFGLSQTLQVASHLLQGAESFQNLLTSEKLKDSQRSQDIFFFQSTQHWIKWLLGWLRLGILEKKSICS